MAKSLKEIQSRLKALEKTASITDAMHNISISKVKTFTKTFEVYTDFSQKFNEILKLATEQIDHHVLINEPIEEKHLIILISSDRGLVGSYHNQLFKNFLEYVKDKKNYQVLVIGRKGYAFARRHKIPMVNTHVISNRDDISILTFIDQIRFVYKAFIDQKITRVSVFYNHFINTAKQVVQYDQILPIKCEKKTGIYKPHLYETKPVEMLESIAILHIETKIYGALVDAKLSEHASRLIAMKTATDNAMQIHEKLEMEYHRVRQQSITNELIDIVNGTLV